MGTNPPMVPNKGQSSGHRMQQVTKIKPALRPQATKPLKKLKKRSQSIKLETTPKVTPSPQELARLFAEKSIDIDDAPLFDTVKDKRQFTTHVPHPTMATAAQRALDQDLWAASTAEQLLNTIGDNVALLTGVSLANALFRLSQLTRNAGPSSRLAIRRHPAIQSLFSQLLSRNMTELHGRDITGVLRSCAWMTIVPPGQLIKSLEQRMAHLCPSSPLSTSITAAWSCAKLGYTGCSLLLEAIEYEALHHPSRFLSTMEVSPSTLTILLWTCAKTNFRSPVLLNVILNSTTTTSTLRPSSLSSAQVSQVAWALGTLKWRPTSVYLEAFTRRVEQVEADLTAQGVACVAWGLSKIQAESDVIYKAAAERIYELNAKELTMVLVAAAGYTQKREDEDDAENGSTREEEEESYDDADDVVLSSNSPSSSSSSSRRLHPHHHHLMSLLPQAEDRLFHLSSTASPRDLADTVCAFASLGYPLSEHTVTAVTQRAQQLVSQYPAHWLSWLVWGLAKQGHRPRELLVSLDTLWTRNTERLRELKGDEACRLAWALCKMNHTSGDFWDNLSSSLVDKVPEMSPDHLSSLLASFVGIGGDGRRHHHPVELLEPAAEHIAQHLSTSYSPRALSTAIWSFGKMEIHPGRGLPGGGPAALNGQTLLTAVANHVERRAYQYDGRALSMLCWAFVTLEHHPGDAFLSAASQKIVTMILGDINSKQHQSGVSLQAVSTIAWACSKFNHPCPQLFAAIASTPLLILNTNSTNRVVYDHMGNKQQPRAVSLANLVYAAGKIGYSSDPVFISLMNKALYKEAANLTVDEACLVLWSYSALKITTAGGNDIISTTNISNKSDKEELIEKLVKQLRTNITSVADCDASLAGLSLYALGVLGYRPTADDAQLVTTLVSRVAHESVLSSDLMVKCLWGCACMEFVPDNNSGDNMQCILKKLQQKKTVMSLSVSSVSMLAWSLIMLKQRESPVFSLVAERIRSLPTGIPADEATQLLLKQASELLSDLNGGCKENMLPQWMQRSGKNEEKEESTVVGSQNNSDNSRDTTTMVVPALKNAATALQKIKVNSEFAKLDLLPQWCLRLRNKQGKKVVVMVVGNGSRYEEGLLLGMKTLLERKGIEGRIVENVACDVVAACYDCY